MLLRFHCCGWVGAKDRQNLTALIEQVLKGHEVTITDRGDYPNGGASKRYPTPYTDTMFSKLGFTA